jgi:hypothetical protein
MRRPYSRESWRPLSLEIVDRGKCLGTRTLLKPVQATLCSFTPGAVGLLHDTSFQQIVFCDSFHPTCKKAIIIYYHLRHNNKMQNLPTRPQTLLVAKNREIQTSETSSLRNGLARTQTSPDSCPIKPGVRGCDPSKSGQT